MKIICSEQNINNNFINTLKNEYNISDAIAKMLVSRGICDAEKARVFFNPTINDLHDPFLLCGMSEAVERIEQAIENEENILIYGDYDADGLSAASILTTFFNEIGVETSVYIPERTDGYGLTSESVLEIIKKYSPSLVITVDCGITSVKEIEYLTERDIDVIVTDHHTPPEILPSCVVINPKLSPEYPFSDLCGAGVALKLASALTDGEIENYLDYAAIATLADSVELTGENRTIVRLGIKVMTENPKPYLEAFMAMTRRAEIKSDDISFYLAPCINAAGRMGNVSVAREFLLSESVAIATGNITKLMALNDERKKQCEYYFKLIMDTQKFNDDYIIVVSDQRFPSGILGILASKLVEQYNKPAIVLTETSEILSGSGRSIDGVDMYQMLNYARERTAQFGGHAMAAGVKIYKDDLKMFISLCNEYLSKLPASVFERTTYYDFDTCEISPLELDKLEPYGVGFPKPRVIYRTDVPKYSGFGKSPSYIKVDTDFSKITTFSGEKLVDIFHTGMPLEFISELSVSTYLDKMSTDMRLLDISLGTDLNKANIELCSAKFLEQLYFPTTTEIQLSREDDFTKELDNSLKTPYGTAIIAASPNDVLYFNNNILPKLKNGKNILNFDFASKISPAMQNTLFLAAGGNITGYMRVFFLYKPPTGGLIKYIEKNGQVAHVLCRDTDITLNVDTSREVFARYYKMIKGDTGMSIGGSFIRWYDIFCAKNEDITMQQFVACMLTFSDLKLIKLDKQAGKIILDSSKSVCLTDSEFYKRLQNLHKGGD